MVDGVLTPVPGYAVVQGIFIGVVAAFVILITIVGPEYVHSLFSSRLHLLIVYRDATSLGNMLPTSKSTRRRSKKVVDVMMPWWMMTKLAKNGSTRWPKARMRDDRRDRLRDTISCLDGMRLNDYGIRIIDHTFLNQLVGVHKSCTSRIVSIDEMLISATKYLVSSVMSTSSNPCRLSRVDQNPNQDDPSSLVTK